MITHQLRHLVWHWTRSGAKLPTAQADLPPRPPIAAGIQEAPSKALSSLEPLQYSAHAHHWLDIPITSVTGLRGTALSSLLVPWVPDLSLQTNKIAMEQSWECGSQRKFPVRKSRALWYQILPKKKPLFRLWNTWAEKAALVISYCLHLLLLPAHLPSPLSSFASEDIAMPRLISGTSFLYPPPFQPAHWI